MEIDPQTYLDTETRIIAENDTHAVIAVRIEKACLARNLSFLAALSNLMPRSEIRVLTLPNNAHD